MLTLVLLSIFIIFACIACECAYKDGKSEGARRFKEEFENYINEHQFTEEIKNGFLNELDYILRNMED